MEDPEQITSEEARTIELGNFTAALLRQDQFNELFEEFKQDSFAQFLSTASHAAKEREGIYAQLNGAMAFLELMKGYAVRRDAIIKRVNDAINTNSD